MDRKTTLARTLATGAAALLIIAAVGSPAFAQALSGTVSSAAEGAMEGVLVSAKMQGSTITTTVVSNAEGAYAFPSDRLAAGIYDVSIRAVGYVLDGSRSSTSTEVDADGVELDLTLQPSNAIELAYQLTDPEWLMSYPLDEETKWEVFRNCNRCHTLRRPSMSNYTVEQLAWVLKRMAYSAGSTPMMFQLSESQTPVFGRSECGPPSPANVAQAEAVAAINLHDGMWDYELQMLPRPSGAATQVIYTTWDLPVTARPHDTRMGLDGYLYFNHFNDNAIGRIDLETGEVQEWQWPYGATGDVKPEDFAPTGARTLMGPDEQNRFYIGNQAQGGIAMFDPATETFTFSNPPNGGELVEVTNMHVDGYAWISSGGEAHRIDLETGEYTTVTGAADRPLARYDVASTSDNSLFGGSRGTPYIWRIDAETLTVQYWDIPAEPRSQGGGPGTGMRRGIVDGQDRLWFGGYDGNFVGVVDPTLAEGEQLKIYPAPMPYFWPYDAHHDDQGYTWTGGQNADRVARIDMETGEWTFYLMPFQTNLRNIDLKPAEDGGPSGLWVGHTHEGLITLVEPLAP